MKKIQVTTIQKTANIEIIELNSSFVAQTVKAAVEAKSLKSIIMRETPQRIKTDDEGDTVKDENGKEIREYLWDEGTRLYISNPEDIIDNLIGFVLKLEAALLGEEK